VNRISVMEIEKLLVEPYATDFPERKYDDKEEMSQGERYIRDDPMQQFKEVKPRRRADGSAVRCLNWTPFSKATL